MENSNTMENLNTMEKKKKKPYCKPTMRFDRFVPNEYIAACSDKEGGTSYMFECNAGDSDKTYYIHTGVTGSGRNQRANYATISGLYLGPDGGYYHPCNETHEASTTDDFLTGYFLDNTRTREIESIPVTIWTDGGTNVHCTTQLDKNTWAKNNAS